MKVDAHQHFWQLQRKEYPWLTASLTAIYQDFGPEQLEPLLTVHKIDKTVLVQAAASLNESRFLLDIAKYNHFVAGVVGWVDFESSQGVGQIQSLQLYAKAGRSGSACLLKGLRPMVQDIAEPDWLLKPQLTDAIEYMIEQQLCFDALVLKHQLPVLKQFIDRYPGLSVVIDHAAKPDIEKGEFASWARDIAAIAADSNSYCKLSGLLTEAGGQWSVKQLQPYVDHLLACFGTTRLIWGSDWPVLNLAANYQQWCDVSEQLLKKLSESERAAIYGLNAQKFYNL